MRRITAGALAAAGLTAALAGAPWAVADPQDLEPYCSAGQVPVNGACLPAPGAVYTDDAPGVDPGVPLGVSPESVPAI